MEKALERDAMRALISERRCQELIERIARLAAEPRQHRLAALARPEDLGKELVRRHEIGARQQLAQLRGGTREKEALVAAAHELRPKAAAPRISEIEKRFLG